MFHRDRTHKIEDAADADDLALKLSCQTHDADAGFRFGGYLWLNDSTSRDALQEYAVVRERDGLQVESVTVIWSKEDRGQRSTDRLQVLARMIVHAAEGGFDTGAMAEIGVFVAIETSEHRLALAQAEADGSQERFKEQVEAIFGDLVERGYVEPRVPAVSVKELFIDGNQVERRDSNGFFKLSHPKLDPMRQRVDLRSDRQKRTDHARAEVCCLPASRHMWSVDLEAWAKAAEWYENRPSGGETDGEALFACLAMFCPEAKTVGWLGVADPERAAFERAAGKLQRHVGAGR